MLGQNFELFLYPGSNRNIQDGNLKALALSDQNTVFKVSSSEFLFGKLRERSIEDVLDVFE